jgi:hypothetical protein
MMTTNDRSKDQVPVQTQKSQITMLFEKQRKTNTRAPHCKPLYHIYSRAQTNESKNQQVQMDFELTLFLF